MKELKKMYVHLQSRMKDEEGATMVEYALMAALIAVVVAVAVGPLGTAIAQTFTDITATL